MTHAADERNYHVFYEMLKGLRPEEKERYGLTAADNYFYLNQVCFIFEFDYHTIIFLKMIDTLREDIAKAPPSTTARISRRSCRRCKF